MSGEHEEHLDEGVVCADCHGLTTNASQDILDPSLHVNGSVDLDFSDSIYWNGTTCRGSCHDEDHRVDEHGW